jgi:putative flavoprotein involved in K+ transport
VIASGACNVASVPKIVEAVPTGIQNVTPLQYKNAESLPEGGVLVVGASATGVQLANEIRRSGRPVTLAVGEHVRMPRRYRGHDVLWWMEASGRWDERYDQVDDLVRARGLPSPQLAGTADGSSLDLNALSDAGVELVGRLAGIRDGIAQFSGSLVNVCALADLKMERTLDGFDQWADEHSPATFAVRERFAPTRVPAAPTLSLDLLRGEIRTIVWATGFRPDYSWLEVPVLDRKGRLRHDGGVVAAPGMYVLGLPLLRRRKSTFIHGAEDDARDLSAHLAGFLAGSRTSDQPWGMESLVA